MTLCLLASITNRQLFILRVDSLLMITVETYKNSEDRNDVAIGSDLLVHQENKILEPYYLLYKQGKLVETMTSQLLKKNFPRKSILDSIWMKVKEHIIIMSKLANREQILYKAN